MSMSSLVLKPSKEELKLLSDDYSDAAAPSRWAKFRDQPPKKQLIIGFGAFTLVSALVGTALFFLLSVEQHGCGEMTIGREFIVSGDTVMDFNMSAPGTVCTLSGENGPIARSYDGYEWEPFGPGQSLEFDCYSKDRCRLKTPSNNQLSLTSYIPEFRLDPLQLDAKFLTQATFGPKMDETRAVKGSYKNWILAQMAEKPTLHRAYLRERSNMRNTVASPLGGIRDACAKNSRWHRYAFTEQDEGKQVSIAAVDDYFELKIDGLARHHAPTLASLGGNPVLQVGDHTLCRVNENPNGNPTIEFGTSTSENVCSTRKTYTNPQIAFRVAPAAGNLLSGLDLVDLNPAVIHAKLLKTEKTGCDTKLPGPLFGRSANVYYLFDPRIETVSNTLEKPFLGTTGSTYCHNAPKTLFNIDKCIVSSTSCQATSFANKQVTLSPEFVSDYYALAGKYVYAINGFEADATYIKNICDGGRKNSRWLISNGACPAGGPEIGDATTLTLFQNLLQNSNDNNPYVRDITRNTACPPNISPPIGVRVTVGNKCYTQTFEDAYNVYDFSTWTQLDTHPGNRAKLEKGEPNPIIAFALRDTDSHILTFPHGTIRWIQNRNRFPELGRLGDVVNYADLPTSVQDLTHAAKYDAVLDGATSQVPGVICGSPGEVAGDPTKGARYGISFASFNDVNNAYPFDDERMNSNNRPKQVVWFNIALKAADQLRQRVAWALSQILVVTEVDVEQHQKNEAYLNYYDIFVRHAFGNYRDVLREVSWSPQMGRMLSYLNSASYSNSLSRGRPSFPDENYAREIMQLFTIGLWELNPDGSQRLDEDGKPIDTYDNEDILEFAKTWTGFYLEQGRGNVENDYLPLSANYVDPMRLRMDYRDPFPKRGLNGHGYVGDRYPLCTGLPVKSEFLVKGSAYRFLGDRDSPELQYKFADNNVNLRRVVLGENSKLRQKLCNNANGGVTNCDYRPQITLDETLECRGLECDIDTVRIVKIPTEPEYCPPEYVYEGRSGDTGDTCLLQYKNERVCPVGCEATNTEDPANPACVNAGTANVCRKPGNEADGLFFEYIRTPCTEMTFFNDGVVIARYNAEDSLCGNPKAKVAAEACCYDEEKRANGYCSYDGEVMTLATANKRCADRFPGEDFGICEFSNVNRRCRASNNLLRHWTNAPCETQAKVGANGKVAVVHDVTNKEELIQMLRVDNENWFRVLWDDGEVPHPDNNCAAGVCTLIEATDTQQASCLCGTSVNETAVFTELPTREQVLEKLFVGEFDPTSDAFELDTEVGNDDVKVFKLKAGTLFDTRTVFQVVDNNGVTRSLRNVLSVVKITGASESTAGFRNPPKFLSFSELSIRDAMFETDAVIDHFFHHPNTPPFIGRLLIQRLITSNPSPRYVKVVGNAFRTGKYEEIGSGKYGDLAATTAAIFLDREARSDVVDWDPATGKLREPILKIVHMMRSLATNTYLGAEVYPEDIENKIGMTAHRAPTVFSFFQPDLTTDGPVAQNSLNIPEATMLQGPLILGMLKAMSSYATYGLQNCFGGFGRWRQNLNCGTMWNQRFTVGSKNTRQTSRATYYDDADLATTAEEVLDELNLLLLGGRLSKYSREVLIEDYYRMNETYGADAAIRSTQQLLLMTPEYHTLGQTSTKSIGRNDTSVADVDPSTLKPFKAIVYVNFAGGADSYNLLIPKESCKNDLFEVYTSRRGLVALLKSEILEIADKDGTQPCEAFGIHPELTKVHELYNADQAVFMANMGPLFEPLTKVNEPGKKQPPSLYAHNTQARFTQTVTPESSDIGVLGRIRDELQVSGYSTGSFSISGGNYVLKGVPGVSPSPDIVNRGSGVEGFNFGEFVAENGREVIGKLNNKTSANAFGETWTSTLHYTMARSEVLSDILSDAETTQEFGGSSLEQQFNQVAKLINSRAALKIDRASFYTAIGGFDTHGNAQTTLAAKMREVNRALTSLHAELEEKGLWDDTVVVFGSEFARTFTNNGVGTDHGWGGNYFAVGGGLKGGRILGQFPEDLSAGSPLDLGRGRILPTTSWDSPWNAIAQWFGVSDDAALDRVAPNRKNFPNLWKKSDMFD